MFKLSFGCTPASASALAMAMAMAVSTAWAQDTLTPLQPAAAVQDATQEVATGTVTIVGQRPGPGLWKVSKGEHVMWVFGTYSPLLKNMEWRSQQVESVIAQSQEYLPPPGGGAQVGLLKGLTLLPHVIGMKNNPNGATLQDVLPPAVYARWTSLKAKYIGENAGIERERPVFVAQTLLRVGRQRAGLSNGVEVEKKISELVKKHQLKVTAVNIKLDTQDPAQLLKDFKKSPMDDAACLSDTMERLETDIDAMRERANAWSKGQLSTIEKLSFADREDTCDKAMNGNSAIKNLVVLQGLGARMKDGWFMAVERALATNKSTFAVLRMKDVLDPNGYLAGLEAKGYTVERPQ